MNCGSKKKSNPGLIEEANYFAQAAQLAAADKKKVEAASPLDVTTKLLEDFYTLYFFQEI